MKETLILSPLSSRLGYGVKCHFQQYFSYFVAIFSSNCICVKIMITQVFVRNIYYTAYSSNNSLINDQNSSIISKCVLKNNKIIAINETNIKSSK